MGESFVALIDKLAELNQVLFFESLAVRRAAQNVGKRFLIAYLNPRGEPGPYWRRTHQA